MSPFDALTLASVFAAPEADVKGESADSSGPLGQLEEPVTTEPVSLRLRLVLCSLFFGIAVTEACSVALLPLTIGTFTENALLISAVLALNPAFGCIAQPLAGVWSDRVWTRMGRRGVFLFSCAPLVAACLVVLPFAQSLVQLVLAVVFLQFFQDVLNGCAQPLLADLVPPGQRAWMTGLVKSFDQLGFVLVLFVGMRFAQGHDGTGQVRVGLPLYWAAALLQIVCVAMPVLFLREKRVALAARPRLSLKRFYADFADKPMLPRLGFVFLVRAFARTSIMEFVALYATGNLGFSESEYGSAWGFMPFVGLLFGFPLGYVVERFPKNRVLQAGFAIMLVSALLGATGSSVVLLTATAVVFGVGDMILEVTHKPFMTEYYPRDQVGQLTGTLNIFYALGRAGALITVGASVRGLQALRGGQASYGVMWFIAMLSCGVGILLLRDVRDLRLQSARGA